MVTNHTNTLNIFRLGKKCPYFGNKKYNNIWLDIH